MWYPASVTTPAGAEPVSLTQVKAHLRYDDTDKDTYLGELSARARDFTERVCGGRFATQTITVKCDCFADLARLPEAPFQSVTSLNYISTDGVDTVLPTTIYELRADGLEASIPLKYNQTWPSQQPKSRITIVAVVGYSTVPPAVAQAILTLVAHLFQNMPAVITDGDPALMALGYYDLLTNFRRNA